MILVHLVKIDHSVLGPEEALTDGVELDGGVAELPVAAGSRTDFSTEKAGEDLVTEADACEVEVGFLHPEF